MNRITDGYKTWQINLIEFGKKKKKKKKKVKLV